MIYDVHNYGAKGDGIHNDAPSIQAAIDACFDNGGGCVVLSGGHVYRSGTIVLKSNVELHIETGAVLKASDDLKDFNLLGLQTVAPSRITQPTYENCDYSGLPTLFFIYAKNSEFVSITGGGKIDGNEEIFYGTITPWHIDGSFYPRIPMVFFENVDHITIKNITLTKSAFWTIHLIGCEDVLIDSIRILNNLQLANCDGIDPDHCRNVRISSCHIECGDDCIVFKNTSFADQYGPCENIVVSNCTLISTSSAIKFGSESEALFKNISVQNCNISRSNRGISLLLRDKGCIEDVIFSNINIETRLFSKDYWWGEAEPITITAIPRKDGNTVGCIKNIIFDNINCTGENGILIYGQKLLDGSYNINDIVINRISLNLIRRTDWPTCLHDLRPCENNTILSGSLNAIYARNAANVRFHELHISTDSVMSEMMKKQYDIEDCKEFLSDGTNIIE